MARPHFPNLDAIAELPDSEVRFYAIVGAVISLTSALEHRVVDIFQRALAISEEQAAAMLLGIRASSIQRDLALTAMTFKVSQKPELAAEWQQLAARIVAATGQRGERNVVGHNPVSAHMEMSGAIGGAPIGALPIGGGPVWEFFVHIPPERLAGDKPPRAVDFQTLMTAAKTLIALIKDLGSFLNRLSHGAQ